MNIIKHIENEIEFYTIESTGESGMSQSGLAILAGVSRQAIAKLEDTLATKSPSKTLEPFVGKALTLVTTKAQIEGNEAGNLSIYSSEFCSAVITHYAFKGNEMAQQSLLKFAAKGIQAWIQEINNWQPPRRTQASYLGYWAERQYAFIQRTEIPSGWFCIFQELAQLMWTLEKLGYAIPDFSPVDNKRIVPDVSIGRMFCAHMRGKGFDVDATVRKYPHWYPGWAAPVDANIYPNAWLEEFRAWFDNQWKPNRLVAYLGKKDPQSLPAISKLLGLEGTEDCPSLPKSKRKD
jgi:hypothetical protein